MSVEKLKFENSFFIQRLVEYYLGDDSLENPILMFFADKHVPDDIIVEVYNELNKHKSSYFLLALEVQMFFTDLWLLDPSILKKSKAFKVLEQVQHTENELVLFMRKMLTSKFNNEKFFKNHYRERERFFKNFYEFDLTKGQLDKIFGNDIFEIENLEKMDSLSECIIRHKDTHVDLKQKVYENTDNPEYLPQELIDVFIF